MSVIRQPCPSCHRELELPGDAAGRLAQCPACQTQFRIGQAESSADGGVSDDLSSDEPSTTTTAPVGSNVDSSAAPIDSERRPVADDDNPFREPLAAGSATSRAAPNPYQPSRHVDVDPSPVGRSGPLDIVARPVDDVISPTMTIFGARWATLMLMAIIMVVVVLVAVAIPAILLAILAPAADVVAIVVGVLLLIPFGLLLTAYLSVGTTRVCLAVARDDPSPLSQLLPPMGIVMRFIVGAFAMLAIVVCVCGLFAGFAFAASTVVEPDVVGIIVAIFGFATLFLGSLVAQWLLWPWMFVVSDDKGTALGSIGTAYQIAKHNKLTSFLLVLLSMILSMVGSACYIGQLVTTPITMLMFAIAYLRMTNQPIADPKQMTAPIVQPPPQSSL